MPPFSAASRAFSAAYRALISTDDQKTKCPRDDGVAVEEIVDGVVDAVDGVVVVVVDGESDEVLVDNVLVEVLVEDIVEDAVDMLLLDADVNRTQIVVTYFTKRG